MEAQSRLAHANIFAASLNSKSRGGIRSFEEHLVAILRPGAAFLDLGGAKVAAEKKPALSTYIFQACPNIRGNVPPFLSRHRRAHDTVSARELIAK